MKILYDISVLGLGHLNPQARTGIFRVVEQTVTGLAQSNECELELCSSHGNYFQCIEYLNSKPSFKGYQVANLQDFFPSFGKIIRDLPIGTRKFFLYNRAEQLVSKYLLKGSATNRNPLFNNRPRDIYHSPFFAIPATAQQKESKLFQTIYDLIPVLHPEFFEFKEDHLINGVIDSLTRDTFVLCISESTRNDLCNYSPKIDSDKTFVVPLAASENFYQCTDPAIITAIGTKYRIPPQASYFLSVSTLEPRKNIDQTIKAFIRILQEQKADDLYLVLTGTKGWDYNRILNEISNSTDFKDKIILTGYVPDEDLAPLYSDAVGFVYPSFYEGFGLPPLEAMQCGTPVITSNTSSLPEVVGDAGIMVSPTDLDALCQAMLDLYGNGSLRQRLSERSLARAGQFSWEKYTQGVIDAYKVALS